MKKILEIIGRITNLEKAEKLTGGKADGLNVSDIAEKHKVERKFLNAQLLQGIKHEAEHTKDAETAKEIALDHLFKDPNYYIKLERIEKGVSLGLLKSDALDLFKGRSGVYSDNATNRRLKRVGKKYGSSAQEEPTSDKKNSKEEPEKKEHSEEELANLAKQSSQQSLEGAVKTATDPKLRVAAQNELNRRQTEETPQNEPENGVKEDDSNPKDGKEEEKSKKDKSEDGNINETKYSNGTVGITIGEEMGSRLRGYVSEDGKEFQIKSVFVNEDERGQGKAKEMYKTLLENLKKKGVETVKSDVQVEENAGRIYESLKKDGFNVNQKEGATLEKDPTGNFWWVPDNDSEAPFEIDLKENKPKDEKSGEKEKDQTGKWVKANEVETGQPIKLSVSHNTEKAPVKYGKTFAQDIEPHGKYMINNPGEFQTPGWEYSTIEFNNPLVLEHKATDASGWKGDLANKFGKKGKALSKELIKRGYDAIITVDNKYNELSEIVSLKDFDPNYKDKRKTV